MASKPSSDAVLQLAKRNVAKALKLDGEGKLKEAYIQYLSSVQYIVGDLLYGSSLPDGEHSSSPRLAILAQQCMDRASELCQEGAYRTPIYNQHGINITCQSTGQPSSWSGSSAKTPECTSPYSLGSLTPTSTGTDSASSLRGRSDSVTTPRTPPNDMPLLANASSRNRTRSPMEIANIQNQKLMTAYRARMSKLGKNEASNLSLSLQRRLAENVAIAQAREKSLAKKIQERNRRLEAQAASRFNSTTGMSKDEQERRQIYTKVLKYEHDTKWLLAWRKKLEESPENENIQQDLVKQIISSPDHPLTSLLKKHQYAVYDKIQPLLVRFRVKLINPLRGDVDSVDAKHKQAIKATSVQSHFEASTGTDTHMEDDVFDYLFESCETTAEISDPPTDRHNDQLSTWDKSYSTDQTGKTEQPFNGTCTDLNLSSIDVHVKDNGISDFVSSKEIPDSATSKLNDLDKEALSRHLNNIVQDIHEYLEKIQTMFVVAYDQLDNPEGRDVIHACIEDPFFKPIWGYLLELYRLANYETEQALGEVLVKYKTSSPRDFKVSEKFYLGLDRNNENNADSSYLSADSGDNNPYGPAISELQSLSQYNSPLSKLECIVRVSRQMCSCAELWYNEINSPVPSIGADDLIPILCYVVVKAQSCQIAAECQALEELMHEGYLMGEEGYCLTTLQTAINYILTLS